MQLRTLEMPDDQVVLVAVADQQHLPCGEEHIGELCPAALRERIGRRAQGGGPGRRAALDVGSQAARAGPVGGELQHRRRAI